MEDSFARRHPTLVPRLALLAWVLAVALCGYGALETMRGLSKFSLYSPLTWDYAIGVSWRALGFAASVGIGLGGLPHAFYWSWVVLHRLIKPTCQADPWNHATTWDGKNGVSICPQPFR